jgi:DNA (cytosine-5)-methyltransferase 1
MPQRRRRTYILAYHKDFYNIIPNTFGDNRTLFNETILGKAFPVYTDDIDTIKTTHITDDVAYVSEHFGKDTTKAWFENAGMLFTNGECVTAKVKAKYDGTFVTLGDIVLKENDPYRNTITEDYYLSDEDVVKWEYSKGYKRIEKINKQGLAYMYSEGAMSFPDPLDKPSRTIITSEMTKSPNRFTHIIKDPVNNRYRRLVPVELERLNMFPDNHTAGETDNKRGFFMGNALVCGVIEKVGKVIKEMFC